MRKVIYLCGTGEQLEKAYNLMIEQGVNIKWDVQPQLIESNIKCVKEGEKDIFKRVDIFSIFIYYDEQ